MGELWYFAYGSNMSLATIARRRLEPRAARAAWLDGYRLCFDIPVGPGERGVANLIADAAARTHGVVYLLSLEEGERLDRTEGVPVGLYARVAVEVAHHDGTRIAAFTYCSTISAPGRKPSPRYIGLLLDGARAHGLPAEYIRTLEALPLAVDERLAQPPT